MTVQKIRIIIIDDHPLFREGLKTILNKKSKYEVAGEAGSGREGLQMVKKLKPDLALLDLSLPDIRGLDLIRDILKSSVGTRILIVSMHSKIDYIVKAFQHGAMGYIVKESAAETLLNGIQHVLKGNFYMDTSVSQQVVKKLAGLPAKDALSTNPDYEALTPREQEVMALLADGMAVSQVADQLCISPKTAENHRSNIMRKLGLHSSIELVRYAVKIGLVDTDLWK
jgi:DNA-binding NarL/FixJ family response regulator